MTPRQMHFKSLKVILTSPVIKQRWLCKKPCLPCRKKQRMVFNLKYYQEMKYEEMSDIFGTSVGALKASYHHAVKKIEKFLGEEY